MNIPILITLSRILMLPIGLYCYLQDSFVLNIAALLLVGLMELSDLFDGYYARKLNQVSDIGKILDPFADHIYRLSFFLFYLLSNVIPIWMFLICFYRDSLVLNLRVFASSNKNTFVAARQAGKIKALFQSIVIMAIILLKIINHKVIVPNMELINYTLMFIATIVTLWSAIDYFIGIINKKIKYFNTIYFTLTTIIFFIVMYLKIT
jgi:cardiolipin synthase